MFEAIEDRPSHVAFVALYLGQVLFAILVPMMLAGVTSLLFSDSTFRPMLAVAERIWWGTVVWPAGFYLALFVGKSAPGLLNTGKLVWAIPTVLLVIAFFVNMRIEPLKENLAEFVYAGSNGEDAWTMMFCTFPACSCICYSLGMAYAKSKYGRR